MKFKALALIISGVGFLSLTTLKNTKEKMANKEKVEVKIWSDVACPFCYLGKKKLEQAIQNLNAEDQVEINWKSFQLEPGFPVDTSYPSIKYLSEKKGYPESQVVSMCKQLQDQGKQFGISYNFDSAKTVNTHNLHRLLQWSKTQNKSNQLKEAFVKAYFSEGIDLSLNENVLKIVNSAGLNEIDAKALLESDSMGQEVLNDIEEAKKLGIRGVPYFIIDGKGISGAQDVKLFEKVLSKAIKSLPLDTISIDQNSVCTPDRICN